MICELWTMNGCIFKWLLNDTVLVC